MTRNENMVDSKIINEWKDEIDDIDLRSIQEVNDMIRRINTAPDVKILTIKESILLYKYLKEKK